MVRICLFIVRLMWSTIAANVVVLPEPVGPVTSTSPLGRSAISLSTSGRLRSSMVKTTWGIRRSTIAGPRRVSSRLMRTRAKPKEWLPSYSLSRRKRSISVGESISRSQSRKVVVSVTGQPVLTMSPRSR